MVQSRKRIRKQSGKKTGRRTMKRAGKATGQSGLNTIVAFWQATSDQRRELHNLAGRFPRFVRVVRDEPGLFNVHVKASYKRTADYLIGELSRITSLKS